jgi:hypothetical protein
MLLASKISTTSLSAKMTILPAGTNYIGVQTAKKAIWHALNSTYLSLTAPLLKTKFNAIRNGSDTQTAKKMTGSAGKTTTISSHSHRCSVCLISPSKITKWINPWDSVKWWSIEEKPWQRITRLQDSSIWKGLDYLIEFLNTIKLKKIPWLSINLLISFIDFTITQNISNHLID